MYEARIKIDLNIDDNELFLQEFNSVNYQKGLKEFMHKAARVEFSKEEALLFELLCDIKKDLSMIIDVKNNNFIKLSTTTMSVELDYEQIKIQDEVKIDNNYYLRLYLNDIVICIFAKAISTNVLKITKIKRYDAEVLDRFVADVQRSIISNKAKQ
ncbi:hypothetical protein [Campylobacter canadensis]|uniref:Uncharacterized protein n=1 Tax=Campylobacter canadensis TaxID=449520 RepID=A0ABS7WQS7_9BACT|nr:hypothetical protein [Campylobacter canadensis]MBZ7987098.1 hypothetical protein [Campylobacter canadensis]MBZ7998134.1 hypothetical protein [Campylobacter canadensis]